MTEYQPPQPQADWWLALAQHLGVGEKAQEFFQNAQANKVLEDIEFDGMGKTKMGFQSPQEFIL